jgi:hypothetical protein
LHCASFGTASWQDGSGTNLNRTDEWSDEDTAIDLELSRCTNSNENCVLVTDN